ncbi:MAG TPA: hypothetical protein VHK01_06000 [Lacipirellulaceae bacterium]|jgi:hypothetical protein|nr:hypothetical protein [Lacipirellulaceae bacterium]
MRHDAIEFAAASANAKRHGLRRSRSERLRDASRMMAACRRPDVEVIDEAFAGFTRVDTPAERHDESAAENVPVIPARLSDCLSAQLNALDRQRTQLVELLRRVDQESQAV